MQKITLQRDLRKTILRGHPWVYREALAPSHKVGQTGLCQVFDKKKQALAWAIYSAEGPLALRILSTDKKPPNKAWFAEKWERAYQQRQPLRGEGTNAYRLFNGEGDGLPGLICDIYGAVAVMQFDGKSCREFWDQEAIAQWLLSHDEILTVYDKPRRSENFVPRVWGQPINDEPLLIQEHGNKFFVDVINGQKTGFFLDQRENRHYIQKISHGKRVLNMFSYTGGFSIYAGRGGAEQVTSVDLAEPALALANRSWQANELPSENHKTFAVDVFDFVESTQDKWDMVIVDPPSMAHSEKDKGQAVAAYENLFAQSARLVKKPGELVLSSCSSHIGFQDFFRIIDEALSKARRQGRVIRITGQGDDHPFPQSCHELRYLKFVHLALD